MSIVVLYEMGHDERSVHSCLATRLLHSNAQPTRTDVLMYSVSETFTVRVALFMAAVDISGKVTNIQVKVYCQLLFNESGTTRVMSLHQRKTKLNGARNALGKRRAHAALAMGGWWESWDQIRHDF